MSVRVVARIRPLLDQEAEKDVIVHGTSGNNEGLRSASSVVRIPNPKNEGEEFTFAFNGVYDQPTTQEDLFTGEVAPHLKSLFQGLDVTIFAYGVTGTGKTHTMRGGLKLADRGVIPRLLSGVYRRAKKITKDSGGKTTVAVSLSYYEIYNDRVFDLLEPPEKRTASGLPLREANGKTQVVGLSERACEDLKDFERVYIEANTNRVTAATKLNAHSSRSHAILRVKLTQTTGDVVRESTASAIDLAGSEDNRRTDNSRERLVESAAINKSLFVLSQCIDAISRGDRRIPFRESKMTRILSLGQNNGITIMILNLAPIRSYHLDTLSSLNVSSRAKRIEVREIENEIVFKQAPRVNSHSSGANMARQPLRPLANAHNIHAGTTTTSTKPTDKKPTDKPVKAFSVYIDRSKPAATSNTTAPRPANTAVKRSPTQKRPSDSDGNSRPSKITRPHKPALRTTQGPAQPQAAQPVPMSAEEIEAMVEKKVQQILASQAPQPPAAAQPAPAPPSPPPQAPEINEAVQRRLDALERRIETRQHDPEASSSSTAGLRLLVTARQHKERGDAEGALRFYGEALPFFPGQQTRLLAKMDKLRAQIAQRQGDDGQGTEHLMPASPAPASARRPKAARAKRSKVPDEEPYQASAEADDDESASDSPSAHTPTRKRRGGARRRNLKIGKPGKGYSAADSLSGPAAPGSFDADENFAAEHGQTQDQTRTLLAVVNSRDASRIVRLQGFGPKRARDLIAYLNGGGLAGHEDDGSEREEDRRIQSLAELHDVPGLGQRAIERALEGLRAGGASSLVV